MQMCPNCDRVYDESEYSKCPFCHKDDDEQTDYKAQKGLVWSPKTGDWEKRK